MHPNSSITAWDTHFPGDLRAINSGNGDSGANSGSQLVASDGSVASALAASTGFTQRTSGYGGSSSDAYVDLSANHVLDTQYDTANSAGNLVQMGQLPANKWNRVLRRHFDWAPLRVGMHQCLPDHVVAQSTVLPERA